LYRASQRDFKLFRFEAEWAGLALVRDAAGGVDQIDSVGPGGVLTLGGVAKFIQHGGKFYSQLSYAGASDQGSLFFTLGTGEDHLIFDVALHLPNIAGVRFRNVNHQEGDLAAVLLVKLVEGRNLPPEGRSGIASKYEHYRPSLRGKF
jgi:hypothetical protein